MKAKKTTVKKIDDSLNRRVTKYRRLKNLVKKSLEISVRCDLKINVLVYDPSQHKIQEAFTDGDFSLNNMVEMIEKNKTLPKCHQVKFNSRKAHSIVKDFDNDYGDDEKMDKLALSPEKAAELKPKALTHIRLKEPRTKLEDLESEVNEMVQELQCPEANSSL